MLRNRSHPAIANIVQSLKLLRGSLPADIEVEHHLAGDALLVQGDENQLKQVLMNLCLNSKDAMSRGGKLTIVTEAPPRRLPFPPPPMAIPGSDSPCKTRARAWTRS